MDQVKTGTFIAQRRKAQGLTQAALAEKLGISDRAVSKWETGKSLPDSGLMLELCGYLDITVNELLSGEKLDMKRYDETAEQNLLTLRGENEALTKKMLAIEWVLGIISTVSFITLMFLVGYLPMPSAVRAVLIALGAVILIAGGHFCLVIEQRAGYYVCKKCGHRHVPTYGQVLRAPHMGRTRYMKCPACGQRSWQKKALSKED